MSSIAARFKNEGPHGSPGPRSPPRVIFSCPLTLNALAGETSKLSPTPMSEAVAARAANFLCMILFFTDVLGLQDCHGPYSRLLVRAASLLLIVIRQSRPTENCSV